MPLPLKADVEAVVPQPCASQARADAHRVQQIHGALLEDPRPHAIDDVLAAAVLDDDGVDAVQVQQMTEQQSCRTCADDTDLRPESSSRVP